MIFRIRVTWVEPFDIPISDLDRSMEDMRRYWEYSKLPHVGGCIQLERVEVVVRAHEPYAGPGTVGLRCTVYKMLHYSEWRYLTYMKREDILQAMKDSDFTQYP